MRCFAKWHDLATTLAPGMAVGVRRRLGLATVAEFEAVRCLAKWHDLATTLAPGMAVGVRRRLGLATVAEFEAVRCLAKWHDLATTLAPGMAVGVRRHFELARPSGSSIARATRCPLLNMRVRLSRDAPSVQRLKLSRERWPRPPCRVPRGPAREAHRNARPPFVGSNFLLGCCVSTDSTRDGSDVQSRRDVAVELQRPRLDARLGVEQPARRSTLIGLVAALRLAIAGPAGRSSTDVTTPRPATARRVLLGRAQQGSRLGMWLGQGVRGRDAATCDVAERKRGVPGLGAGGEGGTSAGRHSGPSGDDVPAVAGLRDVSRSACRQGDPTCERPERDGDIVAAVEDRDPAAAREAQPTRPVIVGSTIVAR